MQTAKAELDHRPEPLAEPAPAPSRRAPTRALHDAGSALQARLLAELDPRGISGEPSLDDPALSARYHERASRTQLGFWAGSWANASPERRAAALIEAVNVELATVGAPPVTLRLDPAMGAGVAGGAAFSPERWDISVAAEMFSAKEPDPLVVQLIYHEGRHAEQFFRMARLLAGRKQDGAAITKRLSLPAAVVERAIARPLEGDRPEAREAEAWLRSWESAETSVHQHTARQSLGGISMSVVAILLPRVFNKSLEVAERKAAYETVQETLRKLLPYQEIEIERDAYAVGLQLIGFSGDLLDIIRRMATLPFEEFDR